MNLDDLKELRRQLDQAIALQESGTRCVTCGQNPNGTAVIGDFVIKRVRNFKPHRQFPKNSS